MSDRLATESMRCSASYDVGALVSNMPLGLYCGKAWVIASFCGSIVALQEEAVMDKALGSDINETKDRERSETSDDDEDEHDPLGDLPDEVQLIVSGEVELSEKQCEAAGHYL